MVAIILVNYQSYNDTYACIESVIQSKDAAYRIFVVDNSVNKDGQQEFLQRLSSLKAGGYDGSDGYELKEANQFCLALSQKLVTIINAGNKGFAAANNIILKQLNSVNHFRYIWLLNNDTKIGANTLKDYIAAYERIGQEKKIGMLGSVLVYDEKPNVIQGVGGKYYKFLGTSRHLLDGWAVEDYQPDCRQDIDYPIGASILVSSAFVADIGVLEESYFLYFEELDWALRAQKKGYACDYAPAVFVRHKAGGSIGGKNKLKSRSSRLSDYYFYRNRMRFSLKYTPFHFPFVIATVGVSLIYRMIRGRAGFLRLFLTKGKTLG